jgi:putative acetyltransferase
VPQRKLTNSWVLDPLWGYLLDPRGFNLSVLLLAPEYDWNLVRTPVIAGRLLVTAEKFMYISALHWQTSGMKIQKLTIENRPRVYALLRLAFTRNEFSAQLVEKLHENDRPLHEWVCLHSNRIIAYIAFSNAYDADLLCGLHLGPMAVTPEFQRQGIGSELLRFVLRQEAIKNQPLFVDGKPGYFSKFDFEPCSNPICPYDKNNAHFLSMRNNSDARFIVGYEPEYRPAATSSPKTKNMQRRSR